MPHDGDGLDPDALSAVLKAGRQAEFVYVLPTFHNPTGRTLTRTARERVADIAVEHDLVVVEDDPYGLLRLEGEPLPIASRSADRAGQRRARDLPVVVLQVGGARASRRLRGGTGGAGRGYRGARHVAVRVAAAAGTGAAVRVPRHGPARRARAGRVRALACPPRRAARGARGAARRVCPLDAPGGGLLPVARLRPRCRGAGVQGTGAVGSRSCPAAGSSRRVAAGAALAWLTATRPSPTCGPPRNVSRS